MAYELFEDLSTHNLNEIAEEDLQQIIKDIRAELQNRKDEEKEKAIAEFKKQLKKY